MQVEGVGEHDAAERLVCAALFAAAVERFLDMHGGDVVGQQDDFVGVQFVLVFAGEVGVGDQAGLEQAGEEDAGSGEGVEHVDAFAAEAAAELLAQHAVGAMQDEIDDFDRRIDDAQAVGFLAQGDGEEFLVKLHQHALPGCAVVEALGAAAHAFVEALEVARFVLQAGLLEIAAQGVERPRHRVVSGEVVMLEQRLEDGPREDVLGDHGHGLMPAYGVVDGNRELAVEGVEAPAQGGGVAQQPLDASDEAGEDVGHVSGPGFPVLAVAAFLDDLGVDGLGRQVERREGQFEIAVNVPVDEDAFGRLVVEVDAVDFGVEAVVVGAQRAQHAPDGGEALVVVEFRRRVGVGRHGDGQHDVAVPLAFGLAHGAAHGLHDIDLRVARTHEQHRVERGHVDAFGKAARVGEDAAGFAGALFQPFDMLLALERVVLSVDVPRFAGGRGGALVRGKLRGGALDQFRPMRRQPLGGGDGAAEGDGAPQRARGFAAGAVAAAPVFGVLQGAPAADDLGRVGDGDITRFAAAAVLGQMLLQGFVHVLFGEGQHGHLVIGEQPLLDRPREGQAVEFRAIDRLVVHGKDFDFVARGLGSGALGVEPRRGRHVQPFLGADALFVMHQHEGRGLVAGAFDAGGAVRFVAQREIERRRALGLRLFDEAERVVGAENDGQRVRGRMAQRRRDGRRVGGDRDFEFLKGGVLAALAGARVGADADVAVRQRPLLGPFAHRLLEQRNRGQQVEHAPAVAGKGLGDAQRGEGFAGSAGHDQLAAVVPLETVEHVVKSVLLMGAQRERLAAQAQVFRLAAQQVGPVDGPLGEIVVAQHAARRLQSVDGFARVGAPAVAGIDHQAGGEGVARRGGDEGIEVGLGDARARRVALALNGAVAAGALLGDKVDADVVGVELVPLEGPFGPQPNPRETLLVNRVLAEVGAHQALEHRALLGLRLGVGADALERLLETAVQMGISQVTAETGKF